jgi:hypothetical protein
MEAHNRGLTIDLVQGDVMLIHADMLPTLTTVSGIIHVMRPLPFGAALTPAVALAYAQALIEAAATAEGSQRINEGRHGE